ncbi:Ribosomal silencing factor RsfS [Porphyridium purpureum]|uniref:Ribosomal silencing factor RsfS n=1 Tax=Porphyridium purpureum TaxID=35688 RepID=A0A5J4Z1Q0_PORPP|nr:Ribosomal silencing factor RsfS [Porphyridium purpureum]|eukprot:POR4856..scf295_1
MRQSSALNLLATRRMAAVPPDPLCVRPRRACTNGSTRQVGQETRKRGSRYLLRDKRGDLVAVDCVAAVEMEHAFVGVAPRAGARAQDAVAAAAMCRRGARAVAPRGRLARNVKALRHRRAQANSMTVVSCSDEEWAPVQSSNPLEDERVGLTDVSEEDDADILKFAIACAKAGDERKASDIVAMRVSHLTVITSFFVFMSANSPPQLRAIANNVEGCLAKEFKLNPRRVSGTHESGWMLLDYGDLMVHVFDRESRKFYDVESRWAAGERIDLSEHLLPGSTLPFSSSARSMPLRDESKPEDWERASPLDQDWL